VQAAVQQYQVCLLMTEKGKMKRSRADVQQQHAVEPTLKKKGKAATAGFVSSTICVQCVLSPRSMSSPLEAVRMQMNDLLLKYSDEFGGVPITFTELSFPAGKEALRILAEQPWLHVDVMTTMLVFKPSKGVVLRGRLFTVSESHVSLFVYGIFNASISASEMSTRFKFDSSSKSWSSPDEVLKENDFMEFIVESVHHANGVLNIHGVLSPPLV